MTKVRPPLSIEQALTVVAALLGWDGMAAVCCAAGREVGERHVRKWGDPDCADTLPIDCALALDVAYTAAGGEGYPIYTALGLMLEAEGARRFACAHAIGRLTSEVMKEGGEAHIALHRLSQPGATDQERAEALREVEEAIVVLKKTLPHLTASAGLAGGPAERTPLGGAPE